MLFQSRQFLLPRTTNTPSWPSTAAARSTVVWSAMGPALLLQLGGHRRAVHGRQRGGLPDRPARRLVHPDGGLAAVGGGDLHLVCVEGSSRHGHLLAADDVELHGLGLQRADVEVSIRR